MSSVYIARQLYIVSVEHLSHFIMLSDICVVVWLRTDDYFTYLKYMCHIMFFKTWLILYYDKFM